MEFILNKNNQIKFRYYTILDFNEERKNLINQVFIDSKQYKRKLGQIEHFASVIIDDCFKLYHNMKGMTYNIHQWTEKRPLSYGVRQKKVLKVKTLKNQGWEILDDESFMAFNNLSANMHKTPIMTKYQRPRTFNKIAPFPERPIELQPTLPPLTDIKSGVAQQRDAQMIDELKAINKQLEAELILAQAEDAPTLYEPQVKSIVEIAPFLKWGTSYADLTPQELDTPGLEEMIPHLVTQSIADIPFFQVLGSDNTFIASAITSAVLAIGTSLHTLFTTKTTVTSKVLNSVAITSSLTTFCLAIYRLFKQHRIRCDITRVTAQLPALAADILNNDIKANSMSWIYPSITTLISIIVGSLTIFQVCDIKSVIEKGRLLQATKGISTTANDVTKFLLEDLAGLDVTGDQKAFDELHKWAKRTAELSVMSPMDFIQNSELNHELHAAIAVSLPILTNKYKSRDLSHAAKSAYSLILTNINKLQEKIEAIKIIGDACKRVETFGVFFGGKKGLGKSRLCTYVTEYIAGILGLPKTIYNLNKSKDTGFYGPYGGAAFAEIQEFMALKELDPNLAHINQIISGDHFNLESAHLSGKQQPFNARIVYLTSNNICPDLLRVLEKEAAKATWDRILRFEVIDDKVQGRTGLNAHRKPDFSHLSFNFVTSSDEVNAANIQKRPVTINDVLGIILYQTALREYQFLNSAISTKTMTEDDIKERKNFLKGIIDRNDAKANSGQDFNIIRLEGPLQSGKTRLADQISHYVHGVLPQWSIVKVIEWLPRPTKRRIYIIDDLIETNAISYTKYYGLIKDILITYT